MFVFDCSSIISYRDYTQFIYSLKNKFIQEKQNLFERYGVRASAYWNIFSKDYFEFRNEYRSLRQNMVQDVLVRFRHFLPKKCLIYEFGSLTKFTDRIESDTDLTICYDEPKTSLFENVEELIDYSIVQILDHTIDHVHGKFQHYPCIPNYDYLTENDNLYVLKFQDGVISYKSGPETLSENIMNIKNVRDYKSLIDGYKEKYDLGCNIDCLYSIRILENTTDHDFLNDLATLENQNNIFFNYRYCHATYSFGENIEISYIKKALKNTIVAMYIMISYLRKKIKWLNQYSMNMDDVFNSNILCDFLGADYLKQLQSCFIQMIFYWDKIELTLKKNDILLSTRCHKWFSKQQLNDMLFHDYQTKDLVDEILKSINNLNNVVSYGWNQIKKYE